MSESAASNAPDENADLRTEVEQATPEAPIVSPSRSDAPVSEVTERFLRAIIAKVPLDRIEELHLFAPLRQGGTETGIAVVAARAALPTPEAVEIATPDQETLALEQEPVAEAAVTEESALQAAVGEESVVEESVEAESVASESNEREAVEHDAVEHESVEHESVEEDESDEIEAKDDVLAEEASDDERLVYPGEDESVVEPAPVERHTVYTARYRLVIKGPERGRWESDVVAEADAPLLTVETVVRGVQRRAGEESEILLFSDKQIARALRMPWPLPDSSANATVAEPAA